MNEILVFSITHAKFWVQKSPRFGKTEHFMVLSQILWQWRSLRLYITSKSPGWVKHLVQQTLSALDSPLKSLALLFWAPESCVKICDKVNGQHNHPFWPNLLCTDSALHLNVTAQSVKTQISLISFEELNFWVEHGLEWRKVCWNTTKLFYRSCNLLLSVQETVVAWSQQPSWEGHCWRRSMIKKCKNAYLLSTCQKLSCGLSLVSFFIPQLLRRLKLMVVVTIMWPNLLLHSK